MKRKKGRTLGELYHKSYPPWERPMSQAELEILDCLRQSDVNRSWMKLFPNVVVKQGTPYARRFKIGDWRTQGKFQARGSGLYLQVAHDWMHAVWAEGVHSCDQGQPRLGSLGTKIVRFQGGRILTEAIALALCAKPEPNSLGVEAWRSVVVTCGGQSEISSFPAFLVRFGGRVYCHPDGVRQAFDVAASAVEAGLGMTGEVNRGG